MNADKWIHPTKFTGNWPDWAGYAWLDWSKEAQCYHPGEDYNKGSGDDDCGQTVNTCAQGIVFHTSKKSTGYGNLIIIKHTLGYNLKRFIKETYGIETDTLYSLYAHLQTIMCKVGEEVDIDKTIATVGKTGTTYCHLHFEIYSLWKDLVSASYRFYPVGWSKEKIKENWLPAYQFIESTKNIESYEQFLGKSKEYWLQVEKDRENLMAQVGKEDQEFLKIKKELTEKIETLETENRQLKEKSANWTNDQEKIERVHQTEVLKLQGIITTKENKITTLENRTTEILAEKTKDYDVNEAIVILLGAIKRKVGIK